MIEVDYITWFTDRGITECPVHFVKAKTPITHDRIIWVYENLRGRFYTPKYYNRFDAKYISFEDPAESMFYDLRWS
jgi:hypothetical protein